MFNEEKTVSGVVKILLKSPLVDEIICINDGSADKSLSILKSFGDKISLIDLKQNHGKGNALAEGIEMAVGDLVVFVDADLTNLTLGHLEEMIIPVLESNIRAILAYPLPNKNIPNIVSDLTGERVYHRKDLLPHLERMRQARFGVEVLLNQAFRDQYIKIPLRNLRGLYKHEKRDASTAFKGYISEMVEIAQEIAKRKGILSQERGVLSRIVDVANLKDLKSKVEQVKDMEIREFLRKYVLNYIKRASGINDS